MGTGPIIDDVARTLAALGTRRRLPAGAAAALGGLAGRSPVTTMATTRRATVRCPYDAATLTGFDIAGRHAQTFKAPATGRLAEVSVRIDHTRVPDGNFVGDYVAQIVPTDGAGAPIPGTVLAEAVVPETGLSFGDQAARFAFGAGAPAVREGRRYAVVVGRSGGRFRMVHRMIAGGDPCPGSVLFTNSSPTGGTFQTSNGFDMIFTAVVRYRSR